MYHFCVKIRKFERFFQILFSTKNVLPLGNESAGDARCLIFRTAGTPGVIY